MRFPSSLTLLLFLTAGCGPELLAVEVLAPRRAPVCATPTLTSAVAGRGLLDVTATENSEGAYLADLRFTSRGSVRIDSLALTFTMAEGAPAAVVEAAANANGARSMGDVLLAAEEPDNMVSALAESVVLLPRSLAKAIAVDGEWGLDDVTYGAVSVSIQPLVAGEPFGGAATFPIELCKGCLASTPSDDECPAGAIATGACRPGQDDPVWECDASSAASFP